MVWQDYLKLFFGSMVVFLAIDLLWLGIVAKGFYNQALGMLRAPKTNWVAAVTFYVIFIVGLLVFAVIPALDRGSQSRALIYGALYGFFTYATYDLTNLATLKDWPLTLSIVDIIWGTALCTVVSGVGYWVGGL